MVLCPAWAWLYTPIAAAIGHHRRYTRATLGKLRSPGTTAVLGRYADSVGLLASMGNRLLLRSAEPSEAQVRFWDTRLVPVSRHLDRLLGHRVGRSVLLVWRKD